MIDRVPPHNLEMEQALLCAILINSTCLDDVDISPGDFYSKKHALIFAAMLEIAAEKQPVDLMTVADRLKRKGNLEPIGGPAYLAQIANEAPVAVNARAYAKSLKGLAVIRTAIHSCMEIIEDGFSTSDPETFLGSAQSKIMALQVGGACDHTVSLDQLCIRATERIKESQEGNVSPGLDIGLPVLGRAMHIAGSKLVIVAARPGMGKTGLMLSMAKFLALQGIRSTILSLEMDADELMDRLLSDEADINNLCFYAPGMIGKKGMADLDMAAGNLSCLPIFIDDTPCRSIQDIERRSRKAKRDGSQVVFIDQLSKVPYPRGMGSFEGYTLNCNRIASLKKELRLPIVLLSQLNRELEKRQDKTPSLSDLKQTGALEEDADIILLLYRPGYYEKLANPKSNPDQSRTDIICAKNRAGATGVEQKVLFNAKRGMFRMLPKGDGF